MSDETVATLREAIRRRLSAESLDGELLRALARLCAEARAREIRAEHVIIVIKHVWSEVPGATRALPPYEQRQVLERIIALCIDEYYDDS